MSLPPCTRRTWIRYGIYLILVSALIVPFAAAVSPADTQPGPDQANTTGNGTLSVGVPALSLNPVGTHYVGDTFDVNGSTNLAVGDQLLVTVYSSSFGPTSKEQASGSSGASGTVAVTLGTYGSNFWSFPVNTSAFSPDTYLIEVSAITIQNARAVGSFTLLPAPVATATVPPTPAATTASPPPVVSTSPVPVPTTTQTPLTPEYCIFAVGVLVILRRVR